MLDHIQTDDGVKFLFLGKRFAVLAVGITHAHVWPVQADIFKIRQVQRINVAGPIHPARNQLQCQIANACADFQYFFSRIGTDDVGHPLGEARRTVQAAEDLAPVNVLGINVVGKTEPENREDGAEAIHPVNLFPFLIRAAGISDGNLKNARATLGELDGNLRLDFKTLADKRDAFQQCRSNHLVTGFHIGEIEVRNDIAQQGQETISKLMTEEKNTTVFAGEEARTKNGVGLLVQENPNHFEEIERMIFEIRIMNDRQLRVRAN